MTTADGRFKLNRHLARAEHKADRPKWVLDPFRLYRRHSRLKREAREEAQHLRRRFANGALEAARLKLLRPDLTQWGRQVVERAIKLLQRDRA